MSIRLCVPRTFLYFSAPITNLDPTHAVRRVAVSLAEQLQHSGYHILDGHVFRETLEAMWLDVAERLGTDVHVLEAQPHLMTDYDLELIQDPRCSWWLGDCTLKSDGVGAESQVAYERLEREDDFAALILIQTDVFEARAASPFIARFRRFGGRSRIVPYSSDTDAIVAVTEFISNVLAPLRVVAAS